MPFLLSKSGDKTIIYRIFNLIYTFCKLRVIILLCLTVFCFFDHFMISLIHTETVLINVKVNKLRFWKIIDILTRHQGYIITFILYLLFILDMINSNEASKPLRYRLQRFHYKFIVLLGLFT